MAAPSSARSASTFLSVSVPRLMRLTMKEMRETLRDRRTIITLLLMPILLYPILTLGFQRFVLSAATNAQVEYLLGVETQEEELILTECLRWAEIARRRKAALKPADADETPLALAQPQLKYEVTQFLERELREYRLDVGIRLKRGAPVQFRPGEDIAVDIELIYQPGNRLGERARDYLSDLLEGASHEFLGYRLRSLQVTQRPEPLQIESVPLRDPEELQNQMLTAIIPVILILMTITGAVYPAIDLTAGERERGTLEMLVAAPVPRLGLLFAKYVAVLSVAFLTASINLAAMTVTLFVSGMGSFLFGDRGLSLIAVGQVFCLLMLFAAFFSAVLLTLTSFARSFKEAQAYLIPLMLVSLGPGLIGLMPGIKLAGALQVAPLVNVVLLSRDLLQGQASLLTSLLVVGSTLLYAAAALALAARIFGTHVILYESQTAWADLFRRPAEVQMAPQISSTMLTLAILFPICFVLKGALSQLAGTNIAYQLFVTSLSFPIVFCLVPWWAAHAGHVHMARTFPFRPVQFVSLVGALICGVSLWPFAHELIVVLSDWGLVSLDENQLKLGRQLIEKFRAAPLVLVLLALSIMPGICEEICFRGYVYRALETRWKTWQTILATGVIFGLFHLVAVDHLAIERLAPTTFMGLILGWIRSRTGSLVAGMLLHVTYNGLIALVMYYEATLTARGWDQLANDQQHLPASWLMAASVASAMGAGLITFATRHRTRTSPAANSPTLTDS